MKLSKLRIQNLRVFNDETIILDDFNCLVGPNGSGKSTVLLALNILFRETDDTPTDVVNLTEEDFYRRSTDDPIIVTATFTDLSEDAQSDFADYYRQGELVIVSIAEYDESTGTAQVKQHGQRKGINEFRKYFEELDGGARVADLKEIYNTIRESFDGLPAAGTKVQMTNSLREYEREHTQDCVEILSTDAFYGFTRGVNRLSNYIQWIYIPAVKDITAEQEETKNTALGKLLSRTVRAKLDFSEDVKALHKAVLGKYEILLKDNQNALDAISESLKTRLQNWAHPNASIRLQWTCEPDKSIRIDEPMAKMIAGEAGFEGDLCRFGHGLQRSYLFALLHELSGCDNIDGPKMILGCEEPELFQHPAQLRHLSDVFYQLSKKNSQIIICTHSPYFISAMSFENIKLVRKNSTGVSKIYNVRREDISSRLKIAGYDHNLEADGSIILKIYQALRVSLNELFFSKVVIFVEGTEDIAYITTYLNLLGLWDAYRKHGCHMIATDGKSHMVEPLVVTKHLDTPVFAIFDSDSHRIETESKREKHRKDNALLLALMGYDEADPLVEDTLWMKDLVMWKSELDQVVEEELGAEFAAIKNEIRAKYGNPGGIEKNSIFIAEVLEKAWEKGKFSNSLANLCRRLIEFAEAG